MSKTRYSLFDVKTNDCPCSCRGIREDVNLYDWRAGCECFLLPFARQTYVITIVRRKSGAYGHCSLKTIFTWSLRLARQTSVCVTLHSQSLQHDFLKLRSATGATTAEARSTRTIAKHVRPRLNVLMYINNKLVSFTYFFHYSIFF